MGKLRTLENSNFVLKILQSLSVFLHYLTVQKSKNSTTYVIKKIIFWSFLAQDTFHLHFEATTTTAAHPHSTYLFREVPHFKLARGGSPFSPRKDLSESTARASFPHYPFCWKEGAFLSHCAVQVNIVNFGIGRTLCLVGKVLLVMENRMELIKHGQSCWWREQAIQKTSNSNKSTVFFPFSIFWLITLISVTLTLMI